MTCLEKYLQEHPDEMPHQIVEDYCPSSFGIMGDPEHCSFCDNDECSLCWVREIPGTEPTTPVIKDSGSRHEFESGAVRDMQEGKGRCDLMPLDVVAEITGDPVIGNIANFVMTGDRGYLRSALDAFAGSNYPEMLLEVAVHFEEGAKKYGEYNWQKGLPVKSFINSAVRHYLKCLRGDKDEPHNRAFCWNVLCACWTCIHKPELNDYGKKNTCVKCGAAIPEGWQYCHTCWENENGGG